MTGRDQKAKAAVKPKYEPTPRETAAISKLRTRKTVEAPRIRFTKEGDRRTLTLDHPDVTTASMLLMEALGTTDPDFLMKFLSQLVNVGTKGRDVDEETVNFMLSIIKGVEPRDQVEAMLAAQMAAVHIATMTFARRLAHVENIAQQDSAERAFNKLTRTFATQMEALKRYRTGGEQKVTVQHVTVAEGGQAIVGNVTQARREGPPAQASASPLALTDAKTPRMPMVEAEGKTSVTAPPTSKKK